MKQPIDLGRCRRGMQQLEVTGTPRPEVIEEAIAAIQSDPAGALLKRYMGVKNYAAFGDQREDHEYGRGPSHGVIVFRIARSAAAMKQGSVLDQDAIYYLEAYRDFTAVEDPRPWVRASYEKPRRLTLGDAIAVFDQCQTHANKLLQSVQSARVETHEVPR